MRNNRQGSSLRRLVSWGLIGVVLATALSTTLAAADPPTASPRSSLLAPSVVARAVASLSPAPARHARDAAQAPGTSSKSFFKTGTGLMVLVVMAAGTGYAVYSAKQDRVRGSKR